VTDYISRQVETGGAGGAVIIDVVDGDLGHAELVEYSLPAGRVAVAVASNALVHIVVVDLCVQHGFDAGFEAELCVVDFPARFDEFGHAYAEDVAWLVALDDHNGGLRLLFYFGDWMGSEVFSCEVSS
jgi:hypothetical protein